jgi:hypothetical protein
MIVHLPLRHRAALAALLFLVAVVTGAWASTLVGDSSAARWGVVAGCVVGLAVAAAVLVARQRPQPPARSLLTL